MSTTNRRGEFRVLGADQLHTIHTQWELVDSYEVDVPVLVYDDHPNANPNGTQGYHQYTVKLGRHMMARRREFLFFLPADAVESATATELARIKGLMADETKQRIAAVGEVETLRKSVTAALDKEKERAKEVERLAGSLNAQRDAAAKMERDIAKLTKALGEVRMREILTEAKP